MYRNNYHRINYISSAYKVLSKHFENFLTSIISLIAEHDGKFIGVNLVNSNSEMLTLSFYGNRIIDIWFSVLLRVSESNNEEFAVGKLEFFSYSKVDEKKEIIIRLIFDERGQCQYFFEETPDMENTFFITDEHHVEQIIIDLAARSIEKENIKSDR